MTPATLRGHTVVALAAVGLALALLFVCQAPLARAASSGTGIGVVSVDGSFQENVTLPGGAYFLTLAPYDASSYVNATLAYNGTVYAQDNRSADGSTPVSLPAGNYSIALAGRGRAALGVDFTNGSATTFPDDQILVAFLTPAGPRVHIDVSLGDAAAVSLHLYDAALVAAGNATVTASGGVDFILPTSRTAVALLVAAASAGPPGGFFGLAWTSGPLNPPIDYTAWPWFLLWIVVPVAVASGVLVALHRRRGR